ncbi:4-hydroxybenzoate polyprenyl transferase [Pleomassaria siparia CBS 279.74]|uniref:4-hydroxybenzoate polyprenyltransferase, mitochondrial n=1 Tax=Pleomassaria siparia CBS 279.74 TaxID=1314801 RepID=A0A6G1K9K5_9PLEO|nr:4-hydroxybenzoate polyprenyl transferase [Pleomassaria siparia CBS 279.74]
MVAPILLRSIRQIKTTTCRHVSPIPSVSRLNSSTTHWARAYTRSTRLIENRHSSLVSMHMKYTNLPVTPSAHRSSATATATTIDTSPNALSGYKPPTTGLLSILPRSVVPYAELIRLDKPTGTYYLFFPCLFSTLVAATMATPMAIPFATARTVALFFTGALVMRGAGCTINDLWDRNLDPHVARTRLRPIARKAVSPQAAIIFTGGQLLTGLGVLVSLPSECFWYATPSLLLVTIYPLAKRVTHYPQFVLGLTFSWGAMMGFPALGIDLLSNQAALTAAACLYWSNVAWTVLYDMIYAHMDIKDDAKAGIKSIALRHDKETKAVLTGLAVAQLGLLGGMGVAAGMGPVFFIGSCGSAAVALGTMIWRVKLKDVKNCWWWFKNGAWFTGGGIALGLTGEYFAQLFGMYDERSQEVAE